MNLHNAKVGDLIRCRAPFSRTVYVLHTVERVTKTLAVCSDASFRLSTGLKQGTGGSYRSVYGQIVTREEVAEYEAEETLERRIKEARRGLLGFDVTADNVAAVEALLAPKPQQESA